MSLSKTQLKRLMDLRDDCHQKGEYYAGHEVGYEFHAIGGALTELLDELGTDDHEGVLKIARAIKGLSPGRYRAWSVYATGRNRKKYISCQIFSDKEHTVTNSNLLRRALQLLRKEGWVSKVRADGVDSKTGPYWVLHPKKRGKSSGPRGS